MPFKIGGKNLLLGIISILFITDISIILDIPLFRQIFGILLITILPGALLYKLLNLPPMNFLEKFVLIVGLSIAVLMGIGFVTNLLYPFMGIPTPLLTSILLLNVNVIIIDLSFISYRFGNFMYYFNISNFHPDKKSIKTGLFLLLILTMSVLGALITRFYKNIILSLTCITLITIFIILVDYDNIIPEKCYASSIFVIAFSLLLARALVSPYLFGSDIQYEYYFAQHVQNNSYWNLFNVGNLNSMLSVNILPIAFSNLVDISFIWMYKIFFSFLYALVPVGLYYVYNAQIGPKKSFYSCIFFISFFSFFTVMLWLPRQEIAELYLALLMIVILNKKFSDFQQLALLIIFTWSLIVSHYGTTYIYLLYLTFVWIGTLIFRVKNAAIKFILVIISYLMAFSWFICISSASIFYSAVDIATKMSYTIFNDLMSSNSIDADISRGVGVGIMDLPVWHTLGNLWISGCQAIIVIGFLYTLIKHKEMKYNKEFFLFSIVSMVLLIACIVVPHFASSLNMNRIYPIILIWLAPLFLQGIETILLMISYLYKNPLLNLDSTKYFFTLLILIPYLLFNSGFIYEITDNPTNINVDIFSENEIDPARYSNWTRFVVSPIYEQNVVGCEWISRNRIEEKKIYTDTSRQSEISGYARIAPGDVHVLNINEPPNEEYIYFGLQNVKGNVFLAEDPKQAHSTLYYDMPIVYDSIGTKNKIYTNDGAEFYS